MARWKMDDVDLACEAWAYQWVQHIANSPDRAGRYIGPMGCTLGRVRELYDGAASNTEVGRHFPEVFLGTGLVVSVALKAMSYWNREVIYRHYLERHYQPHVVVDERTKEEHTVIAKLKRPLKVRLMAERMGISVAEYATRKEIAKACIRTVLYLDTKQVASTCDQTVQSNRLHSSP